MPPKPITKTSKNSKKRKIEDTLQPSIDSLFKKTVPMQIDPPTLGTFRKQLIVPKMSIINFQASRPNELPKSFYAQSWNTHKTMILAIFSDNEKQNNYATAARLCENVCRYGKASILYNDLKAEIEKQANVIKEILSPLSQNELLQQLNEKWESFRGQLAVIRNIFMELDRYYVLSQTKYSSIIQMGIDIFRETVMISSEFRNKIILQVLELIQNDRDGQSVDDRLVKDILYILEELSFYKTDFESKFIEHTTAYYQAEAKRLLKQMPIWDYIHHANQRQQEEIGIRISRYLNIQTKQLLLNAVTNELVYQKVDEILSTGFQKMMLQSMHKPLSVLYILLEGNEKLNLLRNYFGEYIKSRGVTLIQNPKNDSSMVTTLLDFKGELDRVLHLCFHCDDLYANTLKESFEYFINTRKTKPAEMIAKFLDVCLKAPSKKQSQVSEDTNLSAIDHVLVLFRYIQGKDAFEAYHKRYLAKRLLLDRSLSLDVECEVVEKLKSQCGHEFTKNFETMLKDIQVSSDLNRGFKENNKYPIYVKVITQAIWPAYSSTTLMLPPEMTRTQEEFSSFYASRIKGRKLFWQNSLSSCVLTTQFRRGPKELIMSLSQAVVLLFFNNSKRLTYSLGEIKEATSLEEKELNRIIQSLSSESCAILDKKTRSSGYNNNDLFMFNAEFDLPGLRIKVPPVQSDQNVEEKKEVESKVLINRQHQLEAAIVRIMKANKTMTQDALFSEITKKLKFPSDLFDFKRKLESLIERDYVLRDPTDSSKIVYQS